MASPVLAAEAECRLSKSDVYSQLRSSATPLAQVDKRRDQERAHVLGFDCQTVLCGVQHARSIGIHELVGLAHEGLRPGRLLLRHDTQGNLPSPR